MGAPILRVGDLEINQDLRVQERTWKLQRAGWIVMGFFVLLGLTGLLGQGPASRATVGSPEASLWIEYDRTGRHHGSSTLTIHAARHSAPGILTLWIPLSYLSNVAIQQITPPPVSAALSDDGVLFRFEQQQKERAVVVMSLQFQAIGRLSGAVRVADGPAVPLTQFVYP